MQHAARGRAGACDVARILGDLRLIKYDMHRSRPLLRLWFLIIVPPLGPIFNLDSSADGDALLQLLKPQAGLPGHRVALQGPF